MAGQRHFWLNSSETLLTNQQTKGLPICYGLKVCAPTLNLYVEILLVNVMVLGGGALRRWSGHEGGALRNGISDLIKETPESSLVPFSHVGTQQEDGYLGTGPQNYEEWNLLFTSHHLVSLNVKDSIPVIKKSTYTHCGKKKKKNPQGPERFQRMSRSQ